MKGKTPNPGAVKLLGRVRKRFDRKRKKRAPKFSKQDWKIIFSNTLSALLVSMVTQALAKGVPLAVSQTSDTFAPILQPFAKASHNGKRKK